MYTFQSGHEKTITNASKWNIMRASAVRHTIYTEVHNIHIDMSDERTSNENLLFVAFRLT